MNNIEKAFQCSECGKDNIQFQVWAEEGGRIVTGNLETNQVWCESCNVTTTCEVKDSFVTALKKVRLRLS